MSKRNVVHIEIPASDLDKAGKFYNSLFGWKMEWYEQMNYMTWEPLQGPGGGFSPIGEAVKPGDILIHIASDDIDADLVKILELGGKIASPKTEIPGIGWFATFKDPAGNTLALFTSKDPES